MPAPHEMVSAPMTLYVAPEQTLAPDLSGAPPSPWRFLGISGSRSLSDDGLTLGFSETMESQRTLGSTGVAKLFRSEEDLMISFGLLDVTVETFADAFSGLSVTEIAAASGTAGYRKVNLLRGFNVLNQAFLVRGFSPYGDGMEAQYWVPKGYASFSGDLNYTKGGAAMIPMEIMAIEDLTYGYGEYHGQFAPAA